MSKTVLRFLIIALIAVALGALIYHLNQPAGTTSLGSNIQGFGQDFGGEHGGEGGSGSIGGLAGNLMLVAAVTLAVAAVQKLIGRVLKPVRAR